MKEKQLREEKEMILKAEQAMWESFKVNKVEEPVLNLDKLVDHLKMHKIVRLDEVAAQFKTTTYVIAAKITSLQQDG